MKRNLLTLIILGVALALTSGTSFAAEKVPQKVVDLANSTIKDLGSDPVIVQAVLADNAKGTSLAQIQEMDKTWMGTPGVTDFMKSLMTSECGKHLREIQSSHPYFAEIFVMNDKGANVCMTDKTSDYWQGDEDKFKESYKNGTGGIHLGGVKFDDSTQAYLVQVSVPVRDGEKVIGALTVGVDIDKLDGAN